MNRISTLFKSTQEPILNIYATAGYPNFGDTMLVLNALQDGGVDIIEIGMPYSDPVADGETIQQSNQVSLDQGMTVTHLFDQLKNMRQSISVPVLLMGYIKFYGRDIIPHLHSKKSKSYYFKFGLAIRHE
jgi:tryptophan synthase alpha chain